MGLNHLDWKIDVLFSLFMFKKERYISFNAMSFTNLFTYLDSIVALDYFHCYLADLDMPAECSTMDSVRNP